MAHFPRTNLMRPVEGGAFVASNAIVTGDVTLGEGVGVWFGCVLRGDDAPLVVGPRTNIQDLTMIHADLGVPNVIGSGVTVGHRVVLELSELVHHHHVQVRRIAREPLSQLVGALDIGHRLAREGGRGLRGTRQLGTAT